ncbi:hypothetical protein [Halobellus rarus]|uniref:Uncharacterized protein n=1 Tax=Halobellus rarus TaxID=1126237 RepID=A0ABD6CS99_9EURY|nr:hypothetical protein [Halobellus rarus]
MSNIPSWGKSLLFASSYAPLYLVIAFQTQIVRYELFGISTPVYHFLGIQLSLIAIVALLLSAISVTFLLALIYINRDDEGELLELDHYENRGDLVSEYVIVYIFPFVVLDYSQLSNMLSFIVLFLTVGALQIRSNRLYINPVLAALRYDVYKVRVDGDELLLLSKDHLEGKEVSVKTTTISKDVCLSTR